KVPYKTSGEEIGNVDLNYKLFRFFGPTKTITAPIILAQDVEYYKNDYNDANATLSLSNTDIDAWKAASNNNVDLTFSIGNFTETVKGTIGLTTGQIFKANLPIYAAVIIGIIITVVLVVIIINLIRKSTRRNRRNRYYR
ncbi:D-alanyl-D-alanine carboxypeptidase, partial [Clostridium saudiense]|nr:D-alanyl-D-alanine carboxypeptidase [Clostridium saudiense]